MRVDTMVVLKEYDTLSKAERAKELLDNVGMWCMVNNEYMSTSRSIEPTHAQLITRKVDASRALELISTYEREMCGDVLVTESEIIDEYIIY